MEQHIADFLKDGLPEANFEHLHSDDDVTVPQNEPDMEGVNSHRESSGSDSDIDFEWTNREEGTKNFSENNRNFSLDEQSTEEGSMLCVSLDDDDTDENKTQNQLFSLHGEECRKNEVEIHADILQAKDASVLEMVLPKETRYDLETMSPETTSRLLSYQMVDKPKNESSTSKEGRMKLGSTEEHVLQHAPDDNMLDKSTLQDWPVASMEVQSGDEMKEFTEEDENHEREEEGLAEYPSDLSQSDSEDSSEGHEGGQPNHMDTKLAQVQVVELGCSYKMKNLEEPPLNYKVETSKDDNVQRKDECMDPDVKNEDLNVETPGKSEDDILFQTKQDNIREDENNSEISNTGENVPSNSSESYMNEQLDHDSDISSDGDYCKRQGENPDFTSHTISKEKNAALVKQEHNFTKDFATDWNSIEDETVDVVVTESQKEVCDVDTFSSFTASPDAGMEGSSETYSSESRTVRESHPLEDISVKPDKNNKEQNSEHSEVSDLGENINTLLPGTFWNLMDDHNLNLDEYDWDINGEEMICDEEAIGDEEDDFQEEQENDGEETNRDWEKEKARIEAFNKFYQPAEGEENKDRIHKVTFCLDLESCLYEVDSDSEEELSTKGCVSELHPPESSSVKKEQSNMEEVSYIENISTLLENEEMQLDEYDHDNNVEEFCKITSSKATCDDEDDFLEKLKNEIERDMEQEQARIDRYYKESVKEKQNEVTDRTQRAMFRLVQGSSQNEEDDSSEQESNSEDDTANVQKTKDQSDSDEPHERCLYTGRPKVLPKGLQKADKQLKEHPKTNKCLVLLRSVLAVSLGTAVGLLSYCWATDSLDWIY
ncbi:protein starmaker isoform X2 [Pseudorasbora parva]|uniref:protein starmaker isoform X2 n=1 Tax=Pseudorasbora parva TaxID=51549 RepID=UPI00351DE00F